MSQSQQRCYVTNIIEWHLFDIVCSSLINIFFNIFQRRSSVQDYLLLVLGIQSSAFLFGVIQMIWKIHFLYFFGIKWRKGRKFEFEFEWFSLHIMGNWFSVHSTVLNSQFKRRRRSVSSNELFKHFVLWITITNWIQLKPLQRVRMLCFMLYYDNFLLLINQRIRAWALSIVLLNYYFLSLILIFNFNSVLRELIFCSNNITNEIFNKCNSRWSAALIIYCYCFIFPFSNFRWNMYVLALRCATIHFQ